MTLTRLVSSLSLIWCIPAVAMTNAGAPQMPFAFVENHGQAGAGIRYMGLGPDFKAGFEAHSVVLQEGPASVRVTFAGALSNTVSPIITASNPIGARANFLRGDNPRGWQTDLALFGAIHYSGVWPGVELVYKADQGRVKAEYLVAAGYPIDGVQLKFDGATRIVKDGSLHIQTGSGEFVEDKPFLYQTVDGRRVPVEGGFRRLSDGAIGFEAAEYDRALPLVIDPTILFSGYFGGSSQDTITSVAVDKTNNIIVAGWTSSSDLPSSAGARQKSGSVDAFVASFLPNGGALAYCTYLGGSGDDRAFGVAVDTSRNIYITGWTSSTNFPVATPMQSHLNGSRDAFVAKLTPALNSLVYSTYLGGSLVDTGNAIAVDSAGAAVIAGDTTSTNLPATAGTFQATLKGSQDAFVAYLTPAGNGLKFLTYLGGNAIDHASSIAVGGNGNVMVGGYTYSTNYPTYLPSQAHLGGGQDGFVTKLMSDGKTLKFSTYLGGSGGSSGAEESVNGLFVDVTGDIFAAGTTSSSNFPVTAGAYQTTFGGQTDGFVTRFSATGAVLNSTYLGGSSTDGINAIAQDFHQQPYVVGYAVSQDFPAQRPFQNSNAGAMDAFVAKLNTPLSAVTFATYLGGSGNDSANALAVDAVTSIVVAGQTSSTDYPVAGNLLASPNAVLTSFVTKIAPNFTLGVGYAYQSQMLFTADPWRVASYTASTSFGNATDIPVAGDWTGSGQKRIGIFRNGTWILDTNGNGVIDAADKTVVFGQAGDIPVVGDWRGTGRIALGLFRQGTFILDLSGHLAGSPTGIPDATFGFGQGGDLPVVADWSGTGTTKVGVFRNGLWLVDYNGDHAYTAADHSYVYGQAGDIPVVGDWDSSGNPPKIGVYRAGVWILDYDGDNTYTTPGLNELVIGFGFSGYTPLVF